ncbi:DUF2651 family protein [Lysinibacillus sp. LZ02]|uniref:DUF2651 family protein n=1 Tax=Lysinibacillus sp. LZ02 TaxID=3420668 RepID=UPI003D35BEB8
MEFLFIFLILPIIVLIASVLSYLLFKKWFIAPLAVFGTLTILTFTIFNNTFFIWVIVFTIFSIFISVSMVIIKKQNGRLR